MSSLSQLVDLGFDEALARQALHTTGSVEAAVTWLLERPTNGSEGAITGLEGDTHSFHAKMVIVVRTDLKMTTGKVAAQCVHAALGAYRIALETSSQSLLAWEESGEKTVCLRCSSLKELLALQTAADEAGLVHFLVRDAGRTQVDCGSETVLAIGPAWEHLVDAVTGSLGLF
jgi:peptidyl-tRNA hydrolase, PTH2 family